MNKKRFFASAIDWCLIVFLITPVSVLLKGYVINGMAISSIINLFLISSFVLFKDLMFRNASLGKRLMRLHILENNSDRPASVIAIIKRNAVLIVPLVFYAEFIRLIKQENRLADSWFDTRVVPF